MRRNVLVLAATFAATLLSLCTPLGSSAQTQDPLWSIGSKAIHFPQQPGPITATALPTSYNAAIPDMYEYQGQVAHFTQNVQYDEQGNVLFFLVDGNVYNAQGLLIADAGATSDDRDCQVCMYHGDGVAIIPVPGSCTQFYIATLYTTGSQSGDGGDFLSTKPTRIRVGILDVAAACDLVYYTDHSMAVNGKMLAMNEYGNIGLNTTWGSRWQPEGVAGNTVPTDNDPPYLFEHEVCVDSDPLQIRFDVIKPAGDDRYLMVARSANKLHMFIFQADHVEQFANYALDVWQGQQETDMRDNDVSYRGAVALHQNGNTLQVAYSGYRRGLSDMPDGQRLEVGYWEFGMFQPQQPAALTFQPVTGVNPRLYGLDKYSQSVLEADHDYMGAALHYPRIGGLQFSPNGHLLYFTKSCHKLDSNRPLEPQSHFGYIDVTVPCGDPNTCPFYHFLDLAGGSLLGKLADTQLEMNVGPNGTGKALYMIGADSPGHYWLGSFSDPDNPNVSNWQTHTLDLPMVAYRSDDTNPPEYRLLNSRIENGDELAHLQSPACCTGMVLAHDGSRTISAGSYSWTPGNNPFNNTNGPVYIATDLHIAPGAHISAFGLEFRFAPGATLTIDPTGSLNASNCVFTRSCDERWEGIRVRGNWLQHQYGSHPTYQGELNLTGSTVAYANTGVLVGQRLGTLFAKSKSGGVFTSINNDFIDCREGVVFGPYANFDPTTHAPRSNRAIFSRTRFTVDASYVGAYDFLYHVYMWKVDGIPFTQCTFQNLRTSEDHSDQLGQGIYSLDAKYRIQPGCSSVPPQNGDCPVEDALPCVFQGLDHGIHALDATTTRNFTVDRARFENNVCGVYAQGVIGYEVHRSQFIIGGSVATTFVGNEDELFHERYRGLFSTECYGMLVDDNTLTGNGSSSTEGIVIGYSRGHNDIVFRNSAQGLYRGYIGEGVCADPDNKTHIGLQFMCNTNNSNTTDLFNRQVDADVVEPTQHTMRTVQGWTNRPADNTFDRLAPTPAEGDFKSTCVNNALNYIYRQAGTIYEPIGNTANLVGTQHATLLPVNNCASRIVRVPVPPLPHVPSDLRPSISLALDQEKLAYANTRFLYNSLMDGGHPDEVLEEIEHSWPQDAWNLRAYLLSKSPYLSVDALKQAVLKNVLPPAMIAEICVANPDATKKDGFLDWLETNAPQPLDESLIASIVASWDVKTYRSALEAEMGGHHAEMTQAANLLLSITAADSTGEQPDSLKVTWQRLRTPAARYAEALIQMQQQHFATATAVVNSITVEQQLKGPDVQERDRMLALITFFSAVKDQGRDETELTGTEVTELAGIVNEAYDRPATWAQNLLCFAYGRCRQPLTGGDDDGGAPKSIHRAGTGVAATLAPNMTMQPNPANTWTEVHYQLAGASEAYIVVRDIAGREVQRSNVTGAEGRLVLDTREWGMGSYTVELVCKGQRMQTEKLIVRQ